MYNDNTTTHSHPRQPEYYIKPRLTGLVMISFSYRTKFCEFKQYQQASRPCRREFRHRSQGQQPCDAMVLKLVNTSQGCCDAIFQSGRYHIFPLKPDASIVICGPRDKGKTFLYPPRQSNDSIIFLLLSSTIHILGDCLRIFWILSSDLKICKLVDRLSQSPHNQPLRFLRIYNTTLFGSRLSFKTFQPGRQTSQACFLMI